MPSKKATEKPTGSCAACQKEGALLRCVPCRDVGIDIFFCNRDCQVKHWKAHKALCGKSAIVVDLTAGNMFTNENLEPSLKASYKENRKCEKDYAICTNCNKTRGDLGRKLRVCSKCECEKYCSRECQVAHWPIHKKNCKEIAAYEEKMAKIMNPAEAKIRNLLEKNWRFKATMLLNIIVLSTLKHEELEQQPPAKVVYVELEFNHNAQTFLLAEEPKALPIGCFGENKILQMYQNDAKRVDVNKKVQYAFITCKDLGRKCSFFHSVVSEPGSACELPPVLTLQMMCMKTPLKSDLFQGWGAVRDRNFQKQNAHLKKSHLYSMFLQNALQLCSEKPRHLTHGINIHLKMGKEPGQIAEFLNYEVKPLSELKTLNNGMADMASKKEQEYMTEYGLDVQNNPRLLESRKRDPNVIMIVICFQDKDTYSMYAIDSVFLPLDSSGKVTVKKCKKDADVCFKQLQDLLKKMPSELVEKVSM
ncbi:hypothetical protein CTEN210_08819 [Chaetoceros tenuissimus]|uniref:MYND-type domain-containing protein n=1 Tax=Chaetoceros tenuissimus TaxID=426638 RepID=A0AAD3CUG7_9STRA|nr:hypothetical protein CTEN210_08819 [Chaetoceros tenuissimus]